MLKEHVNGFENIGASLNDFKNFHRNVKCYIHERDGQLFIDHFKEMAVNKEGFFFDYDVDLDGSLSIAIWADSAARRNYSAFGDCVSFDPTYTTNKYDMAFTPFTGVDNHMRSVTFCAALVAHEDADSFQWVLSRFLVAMGGKEPNHIITDQDPGILKAVPLVFKKATHRFCMWHIMNKVPTKYGVTREDYIVFIRKINTIIWDEDIEAAEFDARWEEIGEEHGLNNIDWFKEMFSKRNQWVMAHCRDLEMGAVMRTTQISESENSFFKIFEDKSGTLLEFLLRFKSAMDQQRHTHKKLDNEDKHTSPKMETHLALEANGAKVYTHKVFKEFQEEAKYSMDTCKSRGFAEIDSLEVTTVRDASRDKNYDVTYCPVTYKASCSCRMLERKGILCRHIIWIYSSNGVKTIPDEYVLNRWCKDAIRSKSFNCNGNPAEEIDIIDAKQISMSKMWSEVHQTVGILMGRSKEVVDSFSSLIKDFKEKLAPLGSQMSKEQQMVALIGCSTTQEVTIFPLKKLKNKGSGKRLLSSKTKAIALAMKPKRMCKNCKQ
ncbi:protein FAR-RED IMPAIRED RESPONSE 1-like [Silene latifolia]|uniref:protein FAR-RED IMPAIRED RESPONSE 1-like n=1 Tax=Silene latifolia TaxID=37657 RepID=UPI003D76C416